MKKIVLSLVAAAVVSTGVFANESIVSEVELSANVAMTSNYVWRGMTQNQNSPAIQGGFDAEYNNFYAGVWGSNVDFGGTTNVEMDLYAGYASEISGVSYDLNYCQYTYPNEVDASNFGEASLTLGYDFGMASVSGKYYVGVTTNDLNPEDGYEFGVSVPTAMDITLDATYGDYDNVGNYYSVGATKTFGKFDLSLAYTGMDYDAATGGHDEDGTEGNFVATVATSF